MVSLDAGEDAIDAAIGKGCQLLLTHHPLILQPQKSIDLAKPSGLLLAKAIRHSLNIVSLHTNFDIASGGINDLLAERLGLVSSAPLTAEHVEHFVKLAVFVPKGHEEKVMEALFRFSGFMGNYSECSFLTPGTGTFMPHSGARPFIGSIGAREYVEETKIEVLIREPDVDAAMAALTAVHPYEEPAVDLFHLANRGPREGLGRVGEIPCSISLRDLAARIKDEFSLEGLRYVGEGERLIRKISLCGGSGASLLKQAHRLGADVLVTGDVKYHDARDAMGLGLGLIDMGHFASEILMVNGLIKRLETEMQARGFMAELMACETERDPYRYL